MIPGYTMLVDLAEGGMGTVSLAMRKTTTGATRVVALKRLHPRLASDTRARESFRREGEIGMALFHANLVPVLDVVAEGDSLALVMDYVEGASLSRAMRLLRARGQRAPIEIALAIAADALSGLAALHEAKSPSGAHLGIVHRDVSPQNVLVGLDGTCRLFDYGIATTVRVDERSEVLCGKLAYFAPETLTGGNVDVRSDVFAMGIVLHELLTGERLFLGETQEDTVHRLLIAPVPRASAMRHELPPAVDDAIAKSLEREPSMRFASAREMLASIEDAGPIARPREVGSWLASLLGSAVDAQRERLRTALRDREGEPTREVAAPPSAHGRLPDTAATAFVGRSKEVEALKGLFARGEIVVVSGPPGIGKTRLVREVASASPVPVRWVDVASALDVGAARRAIATTVFGVDANAFHAAPVRRLFQRTAPMFVVLDAAEHLVEEALAEWATWTATRHTIVVTSRFGVEAMTTNELRLGGLALPRAGDAPGKSAAEELLFALCEDKNVNASLLERHAGVLVEALALTNGNPLAIEAVARRVLAAASGHEPLEKTLRKIVLDMPHVAITSAGALSWRLFSEKERDLISVLATFSAPFSRRDAARIAPSFDEITFDQLVTKSVVVPSSAGNGLFLLTPGLRRAVFELSETMPEARQAHAQRILDVDDVGSRGADLLFAAETWLASTNEDRIERASRIFVAGRAGFERGSVDASHVSRFGSLLLASGVSTAYDVETHLVVANASAMVGAFADVERHLERARRLAETKDDDVVLARVLLATAWDRFRDSEYVRARALVDEAVGGLSDAPEDMKAAAARYRAAVARELGDTALAKDLNAKGIAHAAATGDLSLASPAIGQNAICLLDEGRWDDAAQTATEALAIARGGRAPREVMYASLVASMAYHFMGMRAAQERALAEALSLEAFVLPRLVAYACGYGGIMALEHGDLDRAQHLLDRAMSIERMGSRSHFLGFWAAAAGALACARGGAHVGKALLDRAEIVLERGPRWARPTLSAYRSYGEYVVAPSDAALELARRRIAAADADRIGLDLHFALRVVRALRPELLARPLTFGATLRVGGGGVLLRVDDGSPIDLSRRAPLARVVGALVDAHERGATQLSPSDLILAAWPGERIPAKSAKNRLHVTLSMLRRLGLRDVLAGNSLGYALAPGVRIVREP